MLASITPYHYHEGVTAKSVARFGDRNHPRRTSAPTDGAFFALVSYGGCAWETSGSAGSLGCRFANLRTAAPILFGDSGDGSSIQGASPMRFPSVRSLQDRAAAHRAMARHALFSDSSARVRMRRYNEHMRRARDLEARVEEVAP